MTHSLLIAEDNEINQRLFSALLSSSDLEIVIVENGLKAVEAAKARRFDLILMDIHMPEVSGDQATKLIRSLGGPYKTIPIIAVSADAQAEKRVMKKSIGMTEFLLKPIFHKTLISCVQKFLGADKPGSDEIVTT